MSSFQDLRFFRSQYNHEAEAGSKEFLSYKTERKSIRVTPLGLCLRIIVDEKTLNLEKTTSSVLSVFVN